MTTSEESPYGALVETTVRIATWNLWWRFGDWEARAPAIEATLRALDADVVAIQEVWEDDSANQAGGLADALGYADHVYATGLDLDGVRFGNAILSRWPITSSEERPLPSPPDVNELRTMVRADIDGPRGPFQVFCTHLNWRFDQSAVRVEQVQALCEFVRDSPAREFPPVICGDFNADPGSDEIRMLTGQTAPPVPKLVFHDAWRAAGGFDDLESMTWAVANPLAAKDLEPDRRLDYIFVGWPKARGRGHITATEVIGRDPVDGVQPSDHYGVMTALRY